MVGTLHFIAGGRRTKILNGTLCSQKQIKCIYGTSSLGSPLSVRKWWPWETQSLRILSYFSFLLAIPSINPDFVPCKHFSSLKSLRLPSVCDFAYPLSLTRVAFSKFFHPHATLFFEYRVPPLNTARNIFKFKRLWTFTDKGYTLLSRSPFRTVCVCVCVCVIIAPVTLLGHFKSSIVGSFVFWVLSQFA